MNRISLHRILILSILLILFQSCNNLKERMPEMPLYSGLSKYHRSVASNSELAQKYFDQGLTLYYGFNHEAAIKSFHEAVLIDSNCAMAWWGQAISAGPNINNPEMDSLARVAAWEAVVKAQDYASGASPVERGLIEALAERYTWPPPDSRASLDSNYASAMGELYERYPDDIDVAVLYADALMNLRPWDLWTPDGRQQPGTATIIEILEGVLDVEPDHPGACHFYIHTMEASPYPEKALPAADILRNRVPGAGHLVHMPSHIDIRLGHYEDAVIANSKAIIADSVWISAGGFYTMYRAHNYHFLAYAAMFDGQKSLALKAANQMVDQIPYDLVMAYPDFLDGFIAVPYHVMVRFGMWEELIDQPPPPGDFYLTMAFYHYAKTVAYAALGRVQESEKEYETLLQAYEQVPESRLIGNNPGKNVLDIGLYMAKGELEYRKKNYDEAFDQLRIAVQMDDSLRYDEPWGWMMPVRHALGALLSEQGRYEEALAVYSRDLQIHPNNGWALKGISNCYHMTGRHAEAKEAESLFAEVWKRSDIELKVSCFCSRDMELSQLH